MKRIILLIAVILITLTGYSQTAKDFYDRGGRKLDKNDYEAAIAEYDISIRIDSTYAYAYYNRANAKYHVKDLISGHFFWQVCLGAFVPVIIRWATPQDQFPDEKLK